MADADTEEESAVSDSRMGSKPPDLSMVVFLHQVSFNAKYFMHAFSSTSPLSEVQACCKGEIDRYD